MNPLNVAVVGGGAAGFFAAIQAKENYPEARVTIYEKSRSPLAKVRVSGGGRCNVTNACEHIKDLCAAYPRGANVLKKAFRDFDNFAAMHWFEARNIPLVTQEDHCVFPRSQDSGTIINCFLGEAKRLAVDIELDCTITGIGSNGNQLDLVFAGERKAPARFDKVIIATGGSPRASGLEWLARTDHHIEPPVPSLFSFRMPNEDIINLAGIVVENVLVSLSGTRFKAEGPLLVTHWGVSGPAILKLSAFAARWLSEQNYRSTLQVNWTHERNQEIVRSQLESIISKHPKKHLANIRPYSLPDRLWAYLLVKYGLPDNKKWNELGQTGFNKMTNMLTNDQYLIEGRSPYKDEFVTCGGISLQDVDIRTMQSKVVKNLYFAGEVLDIDGLTGGFNFQAAWTTAYIAARLS